MKKAISILSFTLFTVSSSLYAGDDTPDAAIGGGLGGAFGAAIGNEVGGRDGAIMGAAIGAAAGTAINTDKDEDHHRDRGDQYEYRSGHYNEYHSGGDFCPPGQAKKIGVRQKL